MRTPKWTRECGKRYLWVHPCIGGKAYDRRLETKWLRHCLILQPYGVDYYDELVVLRVRLALHSIFHYVETKNFTTNLLILVEMVCIDY